MRVGRDYSRRPKIIYFTLILLSRILHIAHTFATAALLCVIGFSRRSCAINNKHARTQIRRRNARK
ncbi:unnamed protein product [Cylicocyclus nassatus]|uniref:Uncharacterized protein n=1 Tax=Cylicocyclus nassatus TaxID=53992 RepID=A0AA36H889_CYLNA|nr:unnamed protein product [Cylicocyclus nassatus]